MEQRTPKTEECEVSSVASPIVRPRCRSVARESVIRLPCLRVSCYRCFFVVRTFECV